MFGFFRKRKTDEYVEKTTTRNVDISEVPDRVLYSILENDGMSDKMRKELLKELDDRRKNKEHV